MAAKRKSPTPEELAAEQVRMGLLREALGFILPEGQAYRAAEALKAGLSPDAVVADVEEAMAALGELTGRTVREDVTARIFERFCVGK